MESTWKLTSANWMVHDSGKGQGDGVDFFKLPDHLVAPYNNGWSFRIRMTREGQGCLHLWCLISIASVHMKLHIS